MYGSALLCSRIHLESTQIWSMCNKGITQFYLPPTHERYLPLLRSRWASPPFDCYSLHLPMNGWPGWVGLGGWLHIEINVPHWELNPDMITHHSTTNLAWCRLTSLIETNIPSLRQTTNCLQLVCLLLVCNIGKWLARQTLRGYLLWVQDILIMVCCWTPTVDSKHIPFVLSVYVDDVGWQLTFSSVTPTYGKRCRPEVAVANSASLLELIIWYSVRLCYFLYFTVSSVVTCWPLSAANICVFRHLTTGHYNYQFVICEHTNTDTDTLLKLKKHMCVNYDK